MQIDELYAVIDGTDGLCGAKIGDSWYPLVWTNLAKAVEARIQFAQDMSNATGKTLTVARFTNRQDIQTLTPGLTPKEKP